MFGDVSQESEKIYEEDLRNVYGTAYLPYAIKRKYPNAKYECAWQHILFTKEGNITYNLDMYMQLTRKCKISLGSQKMIQL